MKKNNKRVPDLTIYAWNTKQAKERVLKRRLKKAFKKNDADIYVMTEVKYRVRELRKVTKSLGLGLHVENSVPNKPNLITEQGDTAIIYSGNVKDKGVAVLTMNWMVFQYKNEHGPRRLPWILFEKFCNVFLVVGVHGPTAGNKEAVEEFIEVTGDIVEAGKRKGFKVVVTGDWNVSLTFARRWASKIKGKVAGRTPDLTFSSEGAVEEEVHGKFKSDHHEFKYEIFLEDK